VSFYKVMSPFLKRCRSIYSNFSLRNTHRSTVHTGYLACDFIPKQRWAKLLSKVTEVKHQEMNLSKKVMALLR
jgi:hypothetical protein